MENLRKYYEHILRNVFGIRHGEYRRAVLMQINIFLIISTLLIVKPTVNGLFLANMGAENLPNAFVLVAIFAGLVSLLYSRLLSRFPLNTIITRTMGWSVISLITFGVLLKLHFLEGWVLYLFYIWVAIFAVLSASQFWILANIVFNAREAKRLFGFIGAGAIAGGIFGGYLTSLMADWIGSENLPFIAASLLIFCIPITQYIWKKEILPTQTHFQRKKRIKGFDNNPLDLIRKSKHLSYLAIIIGIGVIVAKLIDYQFSAIASSRIEDPDDLTAFFGFWFSTFNVVSLIIQLFITRRVVGVFGVGTSLIFLPLGIMLGTLLVFIFPELWAVVFVKLIDGSLKQSVNKSATELMALPIPLEIKNQTKSFIDVFVDSAATGISGLILIFLINGLDLPTRYVSLIILLLIVVWLHYSRKIRLEYLHSFKLKVDQNNESRNKNKSLEFANESVLGGLTKVLQKGGEKQIIYTLTKIKEVPDNRLFDHVAQLLDHPSPVIRAEALRCLYFYRGQRIAEKVIPMINDTSQQVKIAAFEYLIAHASENKVELFTRFLKDKDYKVRGAAMVCLATETRDNPELKQLFELDTRIQKRLNGLDELKDQEEKKFRKIIILKVIGLARLQNFYSTIGHFMQDTDIDVVNEAIIAAGHTLDETFIHLIVDFLLIEKHREFARTALAHYGPAMVNTLSQLINSDNQEIELLHQLPAVLEKIGNQPSVETLFSLVDHPDIALRMEALRSLNNLKIKHPQLSFHKKQVIDRILDEVHLYLETLGVLYAQISALDSNEFQKPDQLVFKQSEARKSLVALLERRLDGNLERIFRLLGLKYSPDDILSIYKGLLSKKTEMRINAVEFLDNLLETNLKKILVPIVETALLGDISEINVKNLNLKIPNEFDCLSLLLSGKDTKINLATLYLITQLNDKKYISLLTQHTQNKNFRISNFAKESLATLLKS